MLVYIPIRKGTNKHSDLNTCCVDDWAKLHISDTRPT